MKKIHLLLLSFYLLSINSTEARVSEKIIGGEIVTSITEPTFSYTVRLLIKQSFSPIDAPELGKRSFSNKCSGVVVSPGKILTAAHCFPSSLEVEINGKMRKVRLIDRVIRVFSWFKAGSPEFTGIIADDYITHPDYDENWTSKVSDFWNPTEKINDIAIVLHREPLNYQKTPIELSERPVETFKNKIFRLSGFGKSSRSQIEMSQLKYVDIKYNRILKNEIDFALGDGNFESPSEVKNPKGGCFGDSGGPIVVDNELIGLISRGPGKENGDCFSSISIGTSIYPYIEWIRSVE
jgi:secreted trypsin-like serine protease